MITEPVTQEMLKEWKKIQNQYKNKIKPDRKSGREVLDYLLSKYPLTPVFDEKAKRIISEIVVENEFLREKMPKGAKPDPVAFYLVNKGEGKLIYDNQEDIFKGIRIFVGVDLSSGYYHVEGSCLLWDELCAFQGLDQADLENCCRVAQYVHCLERFGKIGQLKS